MRVDFTLGRDGRDGRDGSPGIKSTALFVDSILSLLLDTYFAGHSLHFIYRSRLHGLCLKTNEMGPVYIMCRCSCNALRTVKLQLLSTVLRDHVFDRELIKLFIVVPNSP